MKFTIRAAVAADGKAMLALMPRLAAFELPQGRVPEHLWQGDAAMLRDWIAGVRHNRLVSVAENDAGKILGLTLVTLRPEPLSHEPSAHLEVIAVSEAAEGKGVGRALLDAAERDAESLGARSMTLHVFAVNEHARRFYERAGFDGEVIRYIKRFRP